MIKWLRMVLTLAALCGLIGVAAAAPNEPNTDRPGSDYTSVTLPGGAVPANCRALCLADPAKCKAWTYVKAGVQAANPRCWLKNAIPAAKSSSCCTSGTIAAAAPGNQFERNTDRPGGDYTSVTLPKNADAPQCRQLCKADGSKCKAWTYVKAGVQAANPRCWLKNTVPLKKQDRCCVSGVN